MSATPRKPSISRRRIPGRLAMVGFLCLAACGEDRDYRRAFVRHLVAAELYDDAWTVYSELDPDERSDAATHWSGVCAWLGMRDVPTERTLRLFPALATIPPEGLFATTELLVAEWGADPHGFVELIEQGDGLGHEGTRRSALDLLRVYSALWLVASEIGWRTGEPPNVDGLTRESAETLFFALKRATLPVQQGDALDQLQAAVNDLATKALESCGREGGSRARVIRLIESAR